MLQVQATGISNHPVEQVEVIMPDNILNQKYMMDVLEEGWREEWKLEQTNWK